MLWRVSCALRDVWNYLWPYMCAKSLQSCPTLWDPMDWSLPGSSVHGILLTRILEWVAMPLSRYPWLLLTRCTRYQYHFHAKFWQPKMSPVSVKCPVGANTFFTPLHDPTPSPLEEHWSKNVAKRIQERGRLE